MAGNFSALKKNRDAAKEAVTKAAEQENKKGYSNDDERYWKPTVDKSGTGSAVIRFLPPPKDEDLPYIKYFDHFFQGPGGWYVNKSLTTLGKDDPVSEYNSELWNSGIEANKEIARKQKRKLHYVSNILVIKDPGNPANEGKVFLYEYGKKIHDKIMAKLAPEFDDETPSNPFDFWEGMNFRLKIRKVEGYPNYDSSEFAAPSALSDDDKELEKIWNSQHSLQEEISSDKFESYDTLKKKLEKVLKISTAAGGAASHATSMHLDDDESLKGDGDFLAGKTEDAPWDTNIETSESDEDDEDDMKYFNNLLNEDD